ncbi:MAG: AAA family ATPase [Oscillospiraceae bacterium]|jgi:AAA+ ATPase superfamily predicted ATPase|nr:AAA family ATPase [Oscillospiraceae bacterium]MBQ1578328.1 AAA family ATPase [Oscillospiraceae bacterium]MBQ2072401.1 AAA family ATPase [Oscillospiraceae bacterium]MBQ4016801.1 AAA family ATPase [Oscillospiraceae bacterium]
MAFYGREQQQKKINGILQKNTLQAALIFGRRRVGKSELIKQCLKKTEIPQLVYECKQTTELNNVESLSTLISEEFHLPRLGFGSMEALLDYLFRRAEKEKMVLVLDEYPYLRETSAGIDSILQSLIDRYRDVSSLKLILCGSYVEIMKSLLARENPLYGRVDLTIDLKPMDYYESAMFYPDFSAEDKVRLYSVFGGIPYYNRLIDASLSVKENIQELISAPGARLENEVSMYLKSEISKIANANEVFEALSKGFSKYSDILSQSHVSSGPTLIDILDKLIRMEVVEKQAPINDADNRRRSGYFIIDNLSLFYYRYIFRFLSQRSVLDEDVFYDRYIREDFETQYVPRAFESICRQYLIRQNRAGRIRPAFDKIGKYYYDDPRTRTNGEFDTVTEDPQGYIFYESKFRKESLSPAMIGEEIRQVRATGLKCYRYGFFSRSGFQCEPSDDMIFIHLNEMY